MKSLGTSFLPKALFHDLSLRSATDKISHNAMLRAFAYAAQWELGILFLRKMKDQLDSYGQVSAGTCFAIAALWQESLLLLAEDFHDVHGLHVFNVVLAGCAKASQWQRCFALLDTMKSFSRSRLSPDDATYSTVISSCESASLWPRVVALLAEAKASLPFPTSSCNASIAACGAQHQWRWSLGILQSMHKGLRPDILSFKSALSACERAFKWQESLQLLRFMEEAFDRPDGASFTSCASACEQANLWGTAIALLKANHEDYELSEPWPWTVLCRAFATGQCWRGSLHTFTEMAHCNLHDLPALDTVLKSLADAAKWSHSLLLLRLLAFEGVLALSPCVRNSRHQR